MIRTIRTIILCLVAQQACAQYRDAGAWTEGTLGVEYGKKWEFAAVPEMRFDENWSRLSRAFVDLGAQYKLNKFWSAGVVVRSGMAENDGFYEWRNRVQLGLGLRYKMGDWTLHYSPRWQMALTSISGFDADISTNLRNKFQIKYGGFKDWDVATGYEFFHSTSAFQFGTWQNWRWTTQVAYELNKRRSISAGYLVQKRLTGSPQQIDYVVLVGYKYVWNIKKHDKEKKEPIGEK